MRYTLIALFALVSCFANAGIFESKPSVADLNKTLSIPGTGRTAVTLGDFAAEMAQIGAGEWSKSGSKWVLTTSYRGKVSMKKEKMIQKFEIENDGAFLEEWTTDGQKMDANTISYLSLNLLKNSPKVIAANKARADAEANQLAQANAANDKMMADAQASINKQSAEQVIIAKQNTEAESKKQQKSDKSAQNKKSILANKELTEKMTKADSFVQKILGKHCGDNNVNLNFEKSTVGKIIFSAYGNECALHSKEIEITDFVETTSVLTAKIGPECNIQIRPSIEQNSSGRTVVSVGADCEAASSKQILGCSYGELITTYNPCL